MNSGLCGFVESESGAPTRPRRLNIVAHAVEPVASTRSAALYDSYTCAASKAPYNLKNAAAREALEIGAAPLVKQPQTRHTRANERARASSEVASLAVQQCKCYASPADNQTPELFAQASVLHPLASFFRTQPSEAAPATSKTRTLKETTKRT